MLSLQLCSTCCLPSKSEDSEILLPGLGDSGQASFLSAHIEDCPSFGC